MADNKPRYKRVCLECGRTYWAKRRQSVFCCIEDKMAFTNRRRDRGAELYDVLMTQRFARKTKAGKDAWRLVCALASAYRMADQDRRGGRPSWSRRAMERIPLGYSTGGDRR